MRPYENIGSNSGVVAYVRDGNTICVKFHDGWVYVYDAAVIGLHNFQQMITLAESGRGLNSFINRNPEIRKGFSERYKA